MQQEARDIQTSLLTSFSSISTFLLPFLCCLCIILCEALTTLSVYLVYIILTHACVVSLCMYNLRYLHKNHDKNHDHMVRVCDRFIYFLIVSWSDHYFT